MTANESTATTPQATTEKATTEKASSPPRPPADPLAGLTIGRVVWFNRHERQPAGDPEAALVTRVEDREKGRVTLAVFQPGYSSVESAQKVNFDPTGKGRWTWRWPERA